MENVTITNNGGMGAEIYARGRVRNATVTGNGLHGIDAGTLVLVGSTVIGNGLGARCELDPLIRCADLHVYRRPRMLESRCGTSVWASEFRETWGVCDDD